MTRARGRSVDPSRIFALVGVAFGAVFILVNAGGLPSPWDVAVRVIGVVMIVAAGWRVLRAPSVTEPWTGSARIYWLSVGLQIVMIPIGATVLINVFEQPDLVVLWVVFVVGAHFIPAKAFGIARIVQLGAVLMAIAPIFGILHVAAGIAWAPSAGAVLAGVALLSFSALPSWSQSPGNRPRDDDEVETKPHVQAPG